MQMKTGLLAGRAGGGWQLSWAEATGELLGARKGRGTPAGSSPEPFTLNWGAGGRAGA